MIKYAIHVFVATAILSAVVWFGLPLLKAGQPEHYAKVAGFFTGGVEQGAVANGIAAATTRLAETAKSAGTEFVDTAERGIAKVSGASAGDSDSAASSDSGDASDLSDNGDRAEIAKPPKSDDVPAVAATNTTVEAPQADVVAEPPDPGRSATSRSPGA